MHQIGVLGSDQHGATHAGDIDYPHRLPVQAELLAAGRQADLDAADAGAVLELRGYEALALPDPHGFGDGARRELAGARQVGGFHDVALA